MNKVTEEERRRERKYRIGALIFFIAVLLFIVIPSIIKDNREDDYEYNNNFDWDDSKDVQHFIDWSSDRQEERK